MVQYNQFLWIIIIGYTICVSTQKGCKMGCEFCASTKTKFEGNLTTGEIVSQIQVLEKEENIRISNWKCCKCTYDYKWSISD